MQPIVIAPNCPICSKPMVKRMGKSAFWGCSAFPKCRGTKSMTAATTSVKEQSQPTKKEFTPSKYQQAVKTFVLEQTGNAVVKAVAGSGKTSTIEWISNFLPKDSDNVYLVFNAHVRAEAEKKMPSWVTVMTTHQLGFAALRKNSTGKGMNIDADKVNKIVKRLLNQTWDDDKWMIPSITRLVGLVKNLLTGTTDAELEELVGFYSIEVNGSFSRIANFVRLALTESNQDLVNIDFDDMLYLPNKLGLPIPQYDWLLLDEVQDFNNAQIQLVLKSKKPTGRVLAVGDSDQSLYGFRGSNVDAFDKVKSGLDAIELPLSISYRVPLCGVQFVNHTFPSIKFEAFEKAIEGSIDNCSKEQFLGKAVDGDMVLCRTNAPLVGPCFELIRQGRKAIIVGREIGQGLIAFVNKFNKNKIEDLLAEMDAYKIKEGSKLAKREKFSQIEVLNDKIDTIAALGDGLEYTSQLINRINQVFSDNTQGVSFSTVHRAKGLEADNVFILEPQLLPHPMAKKDWEKQQEQNAAYVAYTRFKKVLTFVR